MDIKMLEMIDITAPETVQVQINLHGNTLWVNVDGICRFRACRIGNLAIYDDRIARSRPAEDPDS
jgi:hypothetical protein